MTDYAGQFFFYKRALQRGVVKATERKEAFALWKEKTGSKHTRDCWRYAIWDNALTPIDQMWRVQQQDEKGHGTAKDKVMFAVAIQHYPNQVPVGSSVRGLFEDEDANPFRLWFWSEYLPKVLSPSEIREWKVWADGVISDVQKRGMKVGFFSPQGIGHVEQ